jgi:hypothetical protein
MNPQSPVVQSFLSITKSLTTVTDAVARIEQLRKLEETGKSEFGQTAPPGPSVLMKLLNAGAISSEKAKRRSELQLSTHEIETVRGLINAGLIFDTNGLLHLSQLGIQTAQGTSKIWGVENSQSVDQAISTARIALNLINQEIRRLKGQVTK